MRASIESTASMLARWRPGHRGWFWLCPMLDDQAPPLLFSAIREDTDASALRAAAASLPRPAAAPARFGVATADADGRLSLGGPGLCDADLLRLSDWVRDNVDAHPALARLRDLTLLCIEDGVVTDTFEDPDLWLGVPKAIAPGTAAETVQRLAAARPGMNLWFWMTTTGPTNAPHLAVGLQRDDRDGKRFAEEIRVLRQFASEDGPRCAGILRRADDGLMLTTDAPLADALSILAAVLGAHPQLRAPLADALVIHTGKDGFEDGARLPGADLAPLIEILNSDLSSPAWFWYTDAAANGTPLLLMATDRDALKATAKEHAGIGQTLRGQVIATATGILEFRARSPWPGFIAALAAWAGTQHDEWPGLARLRDAQLIHQRRDGEIVDRQRADAAWDVLD
ncbi:MAG: hypothetical protein AAFV53_06245 [Myxococcota bacterium]